MPLDTKLSDLAVNVQADALAALLDGGFVDVMSGPKAKTADDPVTTENAVLAVLGFGSPAFLPAVKGLISANPLTPNVAVADGDPKWYRAYRADHTTAVFDGTAGKGKGYNMELPARTIIAGVTVGADVLTHEVAKETRGI